MIDETKSYYDWRRLTSVKMTSIYAIDLDDVICVELRRQNSRVLCSIHHHLTKRTYMIMTCHIIITTSRTHVYMHARHVYIIIDVYFFSVRNREKRLGHVPFLPTYSLTKRYLHNYKQFNGDTSMSRPWYWISFFNFYLIGSTLHNMESGNDKMPRSESQQFYYSFGFQVILIFGFLIYMLES